MNWIFTPQLWTLTPQSSSCIQSELKVAAQNLVFGQRIAWLSACHFLHCSNDDEHQMSNRSRLHGFKTDGCVTGTASALTQELRICLSSCFQDFSPRCPSTKTPFSGFEELRPKKRNQWQWPSMSHLSSSDQNSNHIYGPLSETIRRYCTLLFECFPGLNGTRLSQWDPNKDRPERDNVSVGREIEDYCSDILRPHNYQSVWMLLHDLTLHCLHLLSYTESNIKLVH